MKFEWDEAKNERNIRLRQLSFERVKDFEFDSAVFQEDDRVDYGEMQIIAAGYVEKRLYILCFKLVAPSHIRVISFRKANARERKRYEEKIQASDK